MLKKPLFLVILCLMFSTYKLNAQENKSQEAELIFTKPEILPQFVGGMPAFSKFFNSRYIIPSTFKGNGVSEVTFIVEKDGSLSDIQVVNDLGYGTKKELIRVLKQSPKWLPGKLHGKPVRTSYRMPITLVSN